MATRKRIKELLPILQAYAEGKVIQWREISQYGIPQTDWKDCSEGEGGMLFLKSMEYRIKPEPVTYKVYVNMYFEPTGQTFYIGAREYRTSELAKANVSNKPQWVGVQEITYTVEPE